MSLDGLSTDSEPRYRKSLRMQLLEKTVSELSTWGIVHCDLLKQVVVAAAVLASEADKRAITLLLNTVQQGRSTCFPWTLLPKE